MRSSGDISTSKARALAPGSTCVGFFPLTRVAGVNANTKAKSKTIEILRLMIMDYLDFGELVIPMQLRMKGRGLLNVSEQAASRGWVIGNQTIHPHPKHTAHIRFTIHGPDV